MYPLTFLCFLYLIIFYVTFIFVVHMAPSKTTQTRAQLDIEEELEKKQEKQREYSAKYRASKNSMSST